MSDLQNYALIAEHMHKIFVFIYFINMNYKIISFTFRPNIPAIRIHTSRATIVLMFRLVQKKWLASQQQEKQRLLPWSCGF